MYKNLSDNNHNQKCWFILVLQKGAAFQENNFWSSFCRKKVFFLNHFVIIGLWKRFFFLYILDSSLSSFRMLDPRLHLMMQCRWKVSKIPSFMGQLEIYGQTFFFGTIRNWFEMAKKQQLPALLVVFGDVLWNDVSFKAGYVWYFRVFS